MVKREDEQVVSCFMACVCICSRSGHMLGPIAPSVSVAEDDNVVILVKQTN